MSVVINSNYAATVASNNLAASNQLLQRSLNRLSSGSKIVNPSDDAGGLAVSMKLSAAAKRQGAVSTNIANANSLLQTQDGVLATAGKVLNRISELKVLYSDVTKSSSDRANYQAEFAALQAQLTSMGSEKFNGVSLFGSTGLSVATTEDGSSSVTAAAIALMGTPAFPTLTDNFDDLSNWNDTSSGGGSMYLNGNTMVLYGGVFGVGGATSTQSFSEAFHLTMDLNISGGSHDFDMSIGGTSILAADGISNAGNSTVVVDYDGVDTVTTTVNGVQSVQTGVGALSGNIDMSNSPNGDVVVSNFQISSTSTGNVASVASAANLGSLSLSSITGSIQDIATYRAQNGASQSRLEFASELLSVNKANLEAANSRITDVDVAQESTELARYNILVQAGTAMLSQANQSSQIALKLLG